MLARLTEQSAILQGLLWLGLVGIVALLKVVIGSCLEGKTTPPSRTSYLVFVLEELRRLRDRGRLTSAEYEALKRRMLSGS